MLILTRKKDEAIRIGDDIVITVVAVEKNSVRIGIEAPKELRILREELAQAIEEENQKAAEKADENLLKRLKNQLRQPRS